MLLSKTEILPSPYFVASMCDLLGYFYSSLTVQSHGWNSNGNAMKTLTVVFQLSHKTHRKGFKDPIHLLPKNSKLNIIALGMYIFIHFTFMFLPFISYYLSS